MARILILGPSGTGKSTSCCPIPELGIAGLPKESTYFITATTKPLPFKNSKNVYKITDLNNLRKGKRVCTNDGKVIAQVIEWLGNNAPPIKNIVTDDSNYVMQDYYMANAHRKGYDVFKEIGELMNLIFVAAEKLPEDKHFIMLAHSEEYKDSNLDTVSYRFKTVGKMVQDYITPEGKFDMVLYTKQEFDHENKVLKKYFVTNYDGKYPAKSPIGMFEETVIPNDMGYVIKKVNEYYGIN